MTDVDKLTGLNDRASYDDAILDALRDARESDTPLGLVVVDIDHFKQVNDTHGHPRGDEVLKAVARSVMRTVGAKGTAYRYGGEEFVVILRNYSEDETVALAERLRRQIESEPTAGLPVTASLGVAVFPIHGTTDAELFEHADAAMYDAKNRGRNLVRVYGEPPPSEDRQRPKRKRAEAGPLTEDEQEQIRAQYFRTGGARCPRDDARLTITELGAIGVATPDLMVHCKMCGLTDQI